MDAYTTNILLALIWDYCVVMIPYDVNGCSKKAFL